MPTRKPAKKGKITVRNMGIGEGIAFELGNAKTKAEKSLQNFGKTKVRPALAGAKGAATKMWNNYQAALKKPASLKTRQQMWAEGGKGKMPTK